MRIIIYKFFAMEQKQLVDPDFIEDNDGTPCISNSIIDNVEISLNAVGKASKLKVSKIKVKKRHTF